MNNILFLFKFQRAIMHKNTLKKKRSLLLI